MKARFFSILLLVLFLTAGCGEVPTAQPPAGQSPVPPPTVESYPLAPTSTPRPPRPTPTSTPLPTPFPTSTPWPTPLVVQPTPYAPEGELPEEFPSIVYAVQRSGQPAQIWTLGYEEGLLEEELLIHLSPEELASRIDPTFSRLGYLAVQALSVSPDARHIGVWLRDWRDLVDHGLIVGIGGSLLAVVLPMSIGGGRILDWIPDGERIVVAGSMGANWGTMRLDGSAFVLFPVDDVLEAVALPGAQRIVFSQLASLPEPPLAVIDVNGQDLTPLPVPDPLPGTHVRNLVLSPDSRACAFTWALGPFWRGAGQIWVMDVDGSDQRPLGSDTTYDNDLAWSPNGRRLVFVRGENYDFLESDFDPAAIISSLWLIDVESREERLLLSSEGQFAHWSPQWLPDGSALVFLSDRGGETNMWFIRTDGTGLQQLTRQGGLVGEIAVLPQ